MTSPETDDLDSFFIPLSEVEENKGDFLKEQIGRRGRRFLQRGFETAAGLPGDIFQTVRSLASSFGGITPEEDLSPLERGARRLVESVPGSSDIRARSAETSPELEPRGKFEEFEDELVSDFVSLVLPVGGRIPFARALGLSAIGNLGKETVKELGFSEGPQEATKLGLMLFSGMFGKGRGVNSYINSLYKEAETFIPEGATLKYDLGKLGKVESMLKKGTLNESKAPVLKIIEDIKAKSPSGIMSVDEAIQFDKDINKAIGRSYADKTKKGLLDQLKSAHSSSLDRYAKENPSWGENWKSAKQAYQGIKTSENVKNFIKRNANLKNAAHASILLGIEEATFPGKPLEKLGAAGATAATLYASEIAKRLAKNPALRRYYENVVSASISENKAALARNLSGLERVAKKELEENPIPIFDLD